MSVLWLEERLVAFFDSVAARMGGCFFDLCGGGFAIGGFRWEGRWGEPRDKGFVTVICADDCAASDWGVR